jgi:hypothetical protein
MSRLSSFVLAFVSTSAFASTEIEDFASLTCASPPINIGSVYTPPGGHTTWEGTFGQRLYRACSSVPSSSLGVDWPHPSAAVEVFNDTVDVIAPTSIYLQALPFFSFGGATSVTITGDAGGSITVNLTGGPVVVDLTSIAPLVGGQALTIAGNGGLLMDRLVYELDDDRDLDGYAESQGDCDDLNPSINPSAVEIPGDGIDQDCDGLDAPAPIPPFPAMGVMPSCSAGGPIHMMWKDATPNGPVQVYPSAPNSPPSVMGTGPCGGTQLALTPSLTPPPVTTGNSGSGYFSVPTVGAGVCGFKVQLVDLTTCAVSEVIVLD